MPIHGKQIFPTSINTQKLVGNLNSGAIGNVVTLDGSGGFSYAVNAPTPAGINDSIQYNNGGALSGKNSFLFDTTYNALLIGYNVTSTYVDVTGLTYGSMISGYNYNYGSGYYLKFGGIYTSMIGVRTYVNYYDITIDGNWNSFMSGNLTTYNNAITLTNIWTNFNTMMAFGKDCYMTGVGNTARVQYSSLIATRYSHIKSTTATARTSAVIGGQNHSLSDAKRSLILGGDGITLITDDTIAMPKIVIGRGTGGALPTSTDAPYLLAYDDTTGVVSQKAQPVLNVKLTLTQAQIQALNTIPIEIIPAPGAGKYIQILGASANYAWNSTDYVLSGGTIDNIQLSQGAQVLWATHQTGGSSMIANSGNKIRHFQMADAVALTAPDIGMNIAIDVDSLSDYTGAGGTIDIYVQYVIIDTN
jgi:hypothetical protein